MRMWVHCPRASNGLLPRRSNLVGYVRWDAQSDRFPPCQTIIPTAFRSQSGLPVTREPSVDGRRRLKQQPRGLFPQLLRDCACGSIPRQLGCLSCPQLHTIGISSLLCCFAHRASQPALNRIWCWMGSIRSACCPDVCGGRAAPGPSTEGSRNHSFVGFRTR